MTLDIFLILFDRYFSYVMKWYTMVKSQYSTRVPQARRTLLRKHLTGKVSVDNHNENEDKKGNNAK
jgi:hypothetical protein